jgi:putative ABC transport system substrate-binding protein
MCSPPAPWKALILLVLGAGFADFAGAQDRRLPTVGVLWASDFEPHHRAFLEGMRELGWIDGQNVRFVVRYADGEVRRFPALTAELIGLGVDVLVVTSPAVPAARQATTTIPIVCTDFYDPIAEGVVSSLARPGGNVTGISWQSIDSAGKRLELTTELLPGLRRVAILFQAGDPGAALEVKGLLATARRLKVTVRTFEVRDSRGIEAAFATLRRDRVEALIVSANPLTFSATDTIVRLAATMKLPLISEPANFAKSGFLLTFGPDIVEAYKRGALYVDRILKGAKPGDLPIEQPTEFDLVINLRTARALGLTIPETIMVRATEVIR